MNERQKLFRDVVEEINIWLPSEENDLDNYRTELWSFLENGLNGGSDNLVDEESKFKIEENKESESFDLVVEHNIGVKMFKQFKKSNIKDFENVKSEADYDFLVVVSCGVETRDSWIDLKKKYQGAGKLEDVEVEFIWKAVENFGRERNIDTERGPDIFGGDLF